MKLLSNMLKRLMRSIENSVDSAGDIAFQTPNSRSVCVRPVVFRHRRRSLHRHHMQGTVQRFIATSIQTVSDGIARRSRDRVDAG